MSLEFMRNKSNYMIHNKVKFKKLDKTFHKKHVINQISRIFTMKHQDKK
jgi:hypothetical protein